MNYKLEEIREHFSDFLEAETDEWIAANIDDLHYQVFFSRPYLIGRRQATEWLGDETFNVLRFIDDYERYNLGERVTDLTDPECVVTAYANMLGEEVVADWVEGQL